MAKRYTLVPTLVLIHKERNMQEIDRWAFVLSILFCGDPSTGGALLTLGKLPLPRTHQL